VHLKSLSLAGFKSFADRTRLLFGPGVTVVVGPNGSGKSNLVDAVAWAMGTQGTKSLRTDAMGDVIFAGTATRPALGRAEVSLTFDNGDGSLPMDLAEVTITRRLYQDGTSEYEINGAPCRLLDISELLSDSGVGRHQHIVVGQGRVDQVLNASPEDHRAIIEEAAGVIKHRQRRDRALRRLEATDVDVQRLEDLLTEQQRRMRPLRRQARAAERHGELKAAWRELRLWIGGEQLRTIRGRLVELADLETTGQERLEADRARLGVLTERLVDLRQATGAVGRALERDTAAAARLETTGERLHRIAMVARERRGALESRLQGAGERREDLIVEQSDLRDRLAAVEDEIAEARRIADQHEASFRSLDDEERSLAEQDQMPAEGVVASLRGDLAALEAAERRDASEAAGVEERRRVVTSRLADEQAESESLRDEIRAADGELEPVQATYAAIAERRVSLQDRLEESEERLAEARTEAAAAAARLEAIDAALKGMGDPEARRLAEGAGGVTGAVVSRLDVPSVLAAAVDAALGPWSTALAAEGPEAVRAAVATVKGAGLGGVGVVASVPDVLAPARKVAADAGVDALVDLLGPDADLPLARALIGDVLVVEGWTTAWEVVRRHPHLRAVTPDGDLVTAAGVVAAAPDGAGPAALEAAAVGVERAQTELARARSLHQTARRDFDAVREEERSALEAVEAVEARIAGATEALRLVERSRAEGEGELARLDARRRALGETADTRTERLASLRHRLSQLEGEEAARQAAWEALAARRRSVADRRDAARVAQQTSASALAAATERRSMMQRRLDEVTHSLSDLATNPVDPAAVERLEHVERHAREALAAVRDHIDELRARQRVLREEAGTAGHDLDEAEAERNDLERRISDTRESLSAVAVERAELSVREESAAEGLRRDVDASEEQGLAAGRPEIPDGVDPGRHLEALDAQVRRLGPVNPLAAAEYRDLEERATFLEEQLKDLASSRAELRKVIEALDEEIGRLFREAFEDIAGYFEENFSLLFPGGSGSLSLSDAHDVLASGVDIHAQPLGKKVGKLSLLSGGERSLAALAFLFAVFRARPSPFYVLDEVEAALDDANLRRFLRLVDTLRDSAQLVVITHQQQTMEGADVLYGVTMEPGESSRVLAKRLTRV
jgi:chromosome segregation protein